LTASSIKKSGGARGAGRPAPVTDAFPSNKALGHLTQDRDQVFGLAYARRIRAMGIRDHPVAARSPWQNGYLERLIGSIGRECLDHVLVFSERYLRHLLQTYASYYKQCPHPCHIGQGPAALRDRQLVGCVTAIPILGGLHHQYIRI
jgi:transposase InsO family protein